MVFSSQWFLVISVFVAQTQAVTIRPHLCPTNKIAPYKRSVRQNARTLGAFYDLLAPNGNGGGFPRPPQNSLLDDLQSDDPDDCGEIDDYDENDLSSLTSPKRRQGESRLFFGALLGQQDNHRPERPSHVQFPQPEQHLPPHRPSYPQNQYPQPPRPPYRPDRPQYPQPQYPQYPPFYPQQGANRPPQPNHPPARPPYASGGFFSNNPYRPPSQHYPSDDIKPVYENDSETNPIYRPDLVGGPSGHVVGAKPVRPPYRPLPNEQPRDPYRRYPEPRLDEKDRREKPRRLNSNTSIVGSFIDLLFK